MKYNREDMALFWGGPFSQWFPSNFEIDGVVYNTAEQYMMAEKARLFADEEMEQAIMMTDDPRKQKAIGRNVRNFDKDKWEAIAQEVVYRANYAKFTQDEKLKKVLLDTGSKIIVEASPLDTIWGIGLAETDDDCLDTDLWRGTNWLGEAIMRVRSAIT